MVTTTFTVSGAVLAKAGVNVNTNLSLASGASLIVAGDFVVDKWITEAESLINAATRYNWTDVYASLDIDVKKILDEVSSNLAAIYAIVYDMSGYTSRVEAEDMINVYRDAALRGIAVLRDKKVQKFISDPTTGSV